MSDNGSKEVEGGWEQKQEWYIERGIAQKERAGLPWMAPPD